MSQLICFRKVLFTNVRLRIVMFNSFYLLCFIHVFIFSLPVLNVTRLFLCNISDNIVFDGSIPKSAILYTLYFISVLSGPRQAILVLIAYASSEGSGESAHPRSLARTFAARSYKQWVKRNLQTESQIPGPSEWLGMRSYNLSWGNARRHKFAWRGPSGIIIKD